MLLTLDQFNLMLIILAAVAVVVFCTLFYIDAGYGKMVSPKWGPAINNKVAWILMEAPVFFVLMYMWLNSSRRFETVPLIFFICFEIHYFQRSFIFPLLLKGKSKMPIAIMLMGMIFNTFNGYIQGEWLFFLAPDNMYTSEWLSKPQFWIGIIMYFCGMGINIHSDYVIRHLRKPGDTKHYLPKDGVYKYVTSANYFGEIFEWIGFAIMTWSWAGGLFALWTIANLVPRANSIYRKYEQEFGAEFYERKLKRVLPFIY